MCTKRPSARIDMTRNGAHLGSVAIVVIRSAKQRYGTGVLRVCQTAVEKRILMNYFTFI